MQPFNRPRFGVPGPRVGGMFVPPPQNFTRPPPQSLQGNGAFGLQETFGFPSNNMTRLQFCPPQHPNNNQNQWRPHGNPNHQNNNNPMLRVGFPPPQGHPQPQGHPPRQGLPQTQGHPPRQGHPPPQGHQQPQGHPPPQAHTSGPRFQPWGPSPQQPPFRSPGPQNGPQRFFIPHGGQTGPRFQQRNRPFNPQNKKERVDKRDLPENNKFYCDICDRGYKEEVKYREHIDSHQKCPKEGCSYVAAGKLVSLHIKLQHKAGMAKKIWSLESKEDIERWRQERKKNFPTSANIEQKKAQLAERVARGEVIEEKYFGKMRGRGRERVRGRGRGRGQGRFPNNGAEREVNKEGTAERKRAHGDSSVDGETSDKKQKMTKTDAIKDKMDSLGVFFAGSDSDSCSDSSINSDSDNENKTKKVTKLDPTKTTGSGSTKREVTAAAGLGSLISSYADGTDEEPDEIPSGIVSHNDNTEKDLDATRDLNSNQDCRSHGNRQPRNRNNRDRRRNNKHHPPPVDKSLLEKLLAKEIRRERNQILQCVHYIVKQNFFDPPSEAV